MGAVYTVLLVAAAVAAPPEAAAPARPRHGQFLIPSARSGPPDLFLVEPVTGDAKNVTRTEQAEELYPAYSPDGARVAFVCRSKDHPFEVYVADTDGSNRKLVSHPTDGPTACFAPSWSPDGKKLAYTRGSGADKFEARVAAADGSADDAVRAAAFAPAWSPDGSKLAFARHEPGKPLRLAVMNPDGTGEKVLVPDIGRVNYCLPAWSPDGRAIAYSAETPYGSQLSLVPAAGGAPRQLTALPGFNINPVWVSADVILFTHLVQLDGARPNGGGGFATIKADGTRLDIHPLSKHEPPHALGRPAVYLPRVEVPAARQARADGDANPVRPVGFVEPAAKPLALSVTPVTLVPPAAPGAVGAAAWSADGKRLAVGLEAGPVLVMDFDGKALRAREAVRGHEGPAEAVTFSADGKCVISAGADKSVRTWDIDLKQSKGVETDHTAPVYSVARSADGKFVASGDAAGIVTIRAAATGKPVATAAACDPKRGAVHAVAFGKDDALVFAGCARWDVPVLNGAVAAFDPATGKEQWRTKGTFGGVFALAASPDGSKLAGACLDSFVRVWDAATGKELACWKGHTDRATGVAWLAGGKAVVSCGFDNTVRVWDATTGTAVHTLAAHTGPVVRVAAHPDGKHVVSTGQAGALVVWKVEAE